MAATVLRRPTRRPTLFKKFLTLAHMAPEDVTRRGRPITVKLTPGIITLLAGFFMTALTATVFVVRIDDRLVGQESKLGTILREQSQGDSVRTIILHEQARMREQINLTHDYIRELEEELELLRGGQPRRRADEPR